jgi:hypothetical protein
MENELEQKRLNAVLRQAEMDAEEIKSGAKISVLDPDFIVILFFVAIPFDIILAILAIFDVFVLPWIIGMVISFIPFGIIVIWHQMRTSDISKTKESIKKRVDKIREEIEKHKKELSSVETPGKEIIEGAGKEAVKEAGQEVTKQAGKEVAKEAGQEVTKQAGKEVVKETSKQAVKSAAIVGSKTAVKKGIVALIGTSIPFIGAIPFYTIWVLSTLKEE